MNKTIDRRNFVKASFLGLSTLAFSLSPLRSFAQNTPTSNNPYTKIEALALQRQARELFLQKQYAASAAIYEQLMAAFPARIEYYDSYAKVLNAQHRSLAVAELYLKGAEVNPENPYFKQRLSLSVRRMAAGNWRDATVYQNRYGVEDLWQHSSELLVAALAIKPTSNEFKLNLRDLPTMVERKNRANSKRRYELISLSEENVNNIDSLTNPVSEQWAVTRFPTPKTFVNVEETDRSVERLRSKSRRNLNSREQKLREESKRDSIKERWNAALDNAIARNVPGQVDKYGLKVVNEMPDCTNTVGKLRRFYRRQNSVNRLITLNRVLYTNNNTTPNALSLATSLLRHNNGNGILPECRQLVSPISEYAHILPSIYAVTYYFVRSQIHIRENKPADARNILLEGIQLFDERGGGAAYTLLEYYAATFPRQSAIEGVRILEALCGRGFDERMDSRVQPYVKNYVENTDFEALHISERIKKLRALARMQRLLGGNAQRATETEIAALQRELRNRN